MIDLILDRDEDGQIATVTINRPSKLNALNAAVLRELSTAWSELEADARVRVAILTGSGKAFVAGADIAEMSAMTPRQALEFAQAGQKLGLQMEELRFPIIAAVNGHALGGGTELALCCDFIYASDAARFGQPEVTLGLMPGFGGTQRLARRIGQAQARELIFSGEIIDAPRALSLGLVNRVYPAAELLARAREVADRIKSRGPLAVAASKRVLNQGFDADQRVGNQLEAHAFAALFGTDDQREGTRAFLEKRPPAFKGQ
jgi:enoyl-CoA hydratase